MKQFDTSVASPNMSDQSRKFHTLDGMRGVAAALVITRHAPEWFGLSSTNSFLGVDLFFILSGFVIENAYGERLRSGALNVTRFVTLRWIRLTPLFAIASAAGMFIALIQSRHYGTTYDVMRGVALALPNIVLLPSLFQDRPFSYVDVGWTVFYEFVVNIMFAATHRWLSDRALVAVVLAGLGGMTIAMTQGTVDGGWLWSTAWLGLARVMYGFSLGVLLRRYHNRLPRLAIPFPIILALLGAVLMVPSGLPNAGAIEFLTVAFALPLLVHAGTCVEPSHRWFAICTLLGVASYPFYILQNSYIEFARRRVAAIAIDPAPLAPLSGLLLIICWFLVALAVERWLDRPIRGWLSRRLLSRRSMQLLRPRL